MGERKTLICLVMVFLFLLLPEVSFSTSEKWVEVTTLTGVGGIGSTETFTVDHVDWRIKWEIEPSNGSERTTFLVYVFPATGIKGSEPWFKKIEHYGAEETTGMLNIYNYSGSFYIDTLGSIESYTIMIEQNMDSIPEFSSWIILPIFLVTTLSVMVSRKKLSKAHKNVQSVFN